MNDWHEQEQRILSVIGNEDVDLTKRSNAGLDISVYSLRCLGHYAGPPGPATNSDLLLLQFTYDGNGVHNNNGNVRTQDIKVGTAIYAQSYTHDNVNRLRLNP